VIVVNGRRMSKTGWILLTLADITDRVLIERARRTVSEAIGILEKFDVARLSEKVTIQNHEVTKMEAIYQVVEHFAQHTGQIIFITKMLTGDDLGYFKHLNPGAAARVP